MAAVPTAVTVDLQCGTNGFQHHTHEYQLNEKQGPALVVRRGASFRLFLRFNSDGAAKFNIVSLVISTDCFGQDRLRKSWTIKEISRRMQNDPAHSCPLQMTVLKGKSDSRNICLQLTSKPDAVISKFDIVKVILFQAPNRAVTLGTTGSIYLIFNPFDVDDQVFMGAEKERNEFVMEDTGMLYLRNPKSWPGSGRPWFFGQFESPVLECTLMLLSKSQLPWGSWSDPVKVTRALSAVINCNDEAGLLIGNWSGDYAKGRSPSEWTGSLKIFQEFHSSGGKPVAFGQCWVFSGCLTSAGRTLGIPTRSVTNFSSAHDTNANLLIDRYFHVSGERFEGKCSDSVWNFHVWNEMWMKRPDLGAKRYHGWQVVDATPQELSGGCFKTGPCPVVAVKQGEINVAHDVAFVYAEVNACVKKWVTRDNGATWTEAHSDPREVGECISTKAVGSTDRHDITNLYKYDEGTPEERETFNRARKLALEAGAERLPEAARAGGGAADAPVWELNIVSTSGADVHFGADATAEVTVRNVSDRERLGSCFCAAVITNSAGQVLKKLDAGQMKLELQAGGETTSHLVIKAEQYTEFGHEEIDLVVVAALVDGENRVQTMNHVIGIAYLELIAKVPAKVARRSQTEIVLELKNDLAKTLTHARFAIEGPGLRTTSLEQSVGDVQAGSVATATFLVAFLRPGPISLMATFNSNEMTGVFKQVDFYVDY